MYFRLNYIRSCRRTWLGNLLAIVGIFIVRPFLKQYTDTKFGLTSLLVSTTLSSNARSPPFQSRLYS